MFGGSYFGQSPFASPPVSSAVRRVIRWVAGLPVGLWGLRKARATWSAGLPTENDQVGGATSGWDADTPEENWKPGRIP